MHGEGRGQRIGHVVLAEQLQLLARDQVCPPEPQPPFARVIPSLGGTDEREARHGPRGAGGECEHGGIVGVQHPDAAFGRVAEKQALVGVVGVNGGIAIEVIGGEVGEHADVRGEVRAVVQLE